MAAGALLRVLATLLAGDVLVARLAGMAMLQLPTMGRGVGRL